MSFIKNNGVVLSDGEIKKLDFIIDLYKTKYPNYNKWGKKRDFFNKENEVRTNLNLDETNVDNINIGYILDNEYNLILDKNIIKFMFLRLNGLKSCICKQELYLENNKNKDTCNEQKYLDFFKKELKKLESLYNLYEQNKINIDSNKEKKIEFVKKICKTINWGFEDDFITCKTIMSTKDLHPKTFIPYKQRVLGTRDTEWINFRLCNTYFEGVMLRGYLNKVNFIDGIWSSLCSNTVEHSILLNKYAVLSSYYKDATFIRFILIDGLVMPHRREPSVDEKDKKGNYIGNLTFGPYNFEVYKDDLSYKREAYLYNNFTFYDEKNYFITPPLLRSSITFTYTEFRDLLCYLNLPVFRSTVNKNMLFFPNYDLHQRLLEIQGLPRNYCTYTGGNIDWKWFKEGETVAKEAIKCFCEEYEEAPGYGIKPVEYVWYDIVYPDSGNIKKFIFLVVPFEELEHYTGSDIYKRDGKYYVCNKDEVPEHMVPQLKSQKGLEHVDYIWYEKYLFLVIPFTEAIKYRDKITAFENKENKKNKIYYCTMPYPDDNVPRTGLTKVKQKKTYSEKYLKYKIKYLNLKKLLQKMNNNMLKS